MKTRRQVFFLNVTMLSVLIACFTFAFVEVGFAEDHAAAGADTSTAIEQTSSEEDSAPVDVESTEGDDDATTPFGDDGEEVQEEEQEEGPVCHGVVTCTFYATGQVLKIPFRIIGGLIDFLI